MKLELPGQNNYETAYSRAAEILAGSDWAEIAERTGTELRDSELVVSYFSRSAAIKLPETDFQGSDLPLIEQILILHYLTTGERMPREGKLVQFKQLPGGSFYESTYRKRGPNLILKAFGSNPEALLDAGKKLSGREAEYGDISVTIPVFPKIDVTVIIYRGDEEFPPEASILYRDDILCYLTLEDVALLAGMVFKHLKAQR